MSCKLQREILNYIRQRSLPSNSEDPQSSRQPGALRRSSRISRRELTRPSLTPLPDNEPPFPGSSITAEEFETVSNDFVGFLLGGEDPAGK